MLIEIGKDIVDRSDKGDVFAIQILEYLGMAYQNCKHIVFADKHLVVRIVNSKVLSDKIKNVYRKIQSVLATEIFPVRDYLNYWIKLLFSGTSERQNHIVLMNVRDFVNFEFYEESHLLAENIYDCKFYEQIGKYYLRENNLKWIDICFFMLQGGGSPTCRVYHEEIIKKQHLCLAILDSDKRYPKSTREGGTYKLVKKEDVKAAKPCNCMFEQLKFVREIENLIPKCYLCKRYANEEVIKKKIDLSFFDLKDGLMPKTLWYAEAIEYYKKIFSGDAEVLTNISIYEAKKRGLKKEEFCSQIKNDKPLVPGLKDKVMECFLDDNPNDAISSLTPDTGNQRNEWNRIGKLIAIWGCAPKRSAI